MPHPTTGIPRSRRARGTTLVEVIISVSIFVFIAAAVCSTLVLSLRTFKLAHLDLAAYNLAADLCSQLQLEGYDSLAKRAEDKNVRMKFDDFNKADGSASYALRSRASFKGAAREVLILQSTNLVDVDTDLLTGSVRGAPGDADKEFEKGTSRFTFAVRPEFRIETITDEVSKVPVQIARVSVTVSYPPSTSGLPPWLTGEGRRPVTVSAIISSGTNAGSSYIIPFHPTEPAPRP